MIEEYRKKIIDSEFMGNFEDAQENLARCEAEKERFDKMNSFFKVFFKKKIATIEYRVKVFGDKIENFTKQNEVWKELEGERATIKLILKKFPELAKNSEFCEEINIYYMNLLQKQPELAKDDDFVRSYNEVYKELLKDNPELAKNDDFVQGIMKTSEKLLEHNSELAKNDDFIKDISEIGAILLEETPELAKNDDFIQYLKNNGISENNPQMETVFREILEKNPNLAKDKDFMKNAVEFDVSLIQYDRTNDVDLYKSILAKIQGNPSKYAEMLKINEDSKTESIVQKILYELNNPKQVEKGKYKIPQKFLLEAFRKEFKKEEKANYYKWIESYFSLDGFFPEDVGKKMSELYTDSDHYLLLHNIFSGKVTLDKESPQESICKKGLRTSGDGMCSPNVLAGTTLGNYSENEVNADGIFLTYLGAIEEDVAMLISMPKELIDQNGLIWESNESELIIRR